jgi:hypothetical protein
MVETAEVAGPAAATELVEAVIISGPRRGEIVQLSEDAIPEVSEGDLKLLNAALDQVEAALGRLETTVESAIAQFSAPPKAA